MDSLQRELEETRTRFRTLVENAFDLISEMDEHGVYWYLSPNHQTILGWDIKERLGKNALDFVHPDQRAAILQRLHEAVRHGSGGAEVQVQAADGQWRWFEVTGQSFRTATGELRFVVISRDITARREAEERIRREQEYQRRLVALQDADRRLMAFEIHDGLVQDLYGAQLFFESIQLAASPDSEEAKAFRSGVQLLRGAIEEARRLINGLRPPILDEQGLIAALEHLTHDMRQTWGVQVDFQAKVAFERLSPTVENAIYRIVQEGLSNVRKHAGVDQASVDVTEDDGWICIVVKDEGQGFDPQTVSEKRYGLVGIADRARLLGGEFHIDSQLGAGTTVTVLLPLRDAEDPATAPAPPPSVCDED